MPKFPEHAITAQGQVMYDLGKWAADHSTAPGRIQAERFAAARGARANLDAATIKQLAERSLADWRASQRAAKLGGPGKLGSVFRGQGSKTFKVGVRVVLHLDFPSGKGPTQRDSFQVIITVDSTWTAAEIKSEAARVYAEGQVPTSKQYQHLGTVTSVEIIQVISGGFPQSSFAGG